MGIDICRSSTCAINIFKTTIIFVRHRFGNMHKSTTTKKRKMHGHDMEAKDVVFCVRYTRANICIPSFDLCFCHYPDEGLFFLCVHVAHEHVCD